MTGLPAYEYETYMKIGTSTQQDSQEISLVFSQTNRIWKTIGKEKSMKEELHGWKETEIWRRSPCFLCLIFNVNAHFTDIFEREKSIQGWEKQEENTVCLFEIGLFFSLACDDEHRQLSHLS